MSVLSTAAEKHWRDLMKPDGSQKGKEEEKKNNPKPPPPMFT